jgi:carbohydrate esterase-like sialic acid-specific acetylesterase
MGLTIRHATLSNVQDEGDPGEIGPSEWNESHAIVDNDPLVFLATGQSELESVWSFSWSPQANALVWNWDYVDGHVGSAFTALSSTTIRIAERFASEVARLLPGRKVCVINIAKGSQSIAQWMPGASSPDMLQNILNNVVPALAAIGKTTIDGLIWYQGVSQTATPYSYANDFEAVQARFRAQSWFPRTTPVIVFGLAPSSISGSTFFANDATNAQLQAAVRADQACRRFVDTSTLDAGFWDATVHPNGAGSAAVGTMAAQAYINGPTSLPIIDQASGFLRARVIGRPAFRNLIIGGDFTTNPWQRGTTFTGVVVNNTYSADRFAYSIVGSGVVDLLKSTDAPTTAQAGIFTQHCLDISVTTADTSIAATDAYFVNHKIEGLTASFLGFGQAGARSITISFWVKSTVTGKYYMSVRNSNSDRSYVAPYAINAADTWEFKSVTVPGDTTGPWLYTSGIGLRIGWALSIGSNFQSTPNSWSAGNVLGGSDQVNALGANGNHFKLALVQVEEGVAPSAFEQLPISVVVESAQRYYRKSFELATVPAQNVGTTVGAAFAMSHVAAAIFGTDVQFDVRMRAAPTITTYNPVAANPNWRDITLGGDRAATVADQSESGFTVTGGGGGASSLNYIHWQATAEL